MKKFFFPCLIFIFLGVNTSKAQTVTSEAKSLNVQDNQSKDLTEKQLDSLRNLIILDVRKQLSVSCGADNQTKPEAPEEKRKLIQPINEPEK